MTNRPARKRARLNLNTETPVEEALRHAESLRPDLWRRTRAIASIIDPAAFAEGWICSDGDTERLMESRNRLAQSTAMCKAQEILRYLGVNTQADWFEILSRMTTELPQPRAKGSRKPARREGGAR